MRDYATQLADTKAEIAAALANALYHHPQVREIPFGYSATDGVGMEPATGRHTIPLR
jgi:hypothetical protein